MSADLLYLEDSNGVYLSGDMNVHNFLFLSINESMHFVLSPDEEGFKKAEQIISSLQEWIRHSKEINDHSSK